MSPIAMKPLPLPVSGKITKIVHLSDIHIRTGDKEKCRFDEYLGVYHNLFNQLRGIVDAETVIVITGDVFHNKSRIESPGVVLFYTLLSGLSQLAPVYIIQGNHDYRQDQHDGIDMISAFLHEHTFPNVSYMSKTGYYVAERVGFGVVSVNDTLEKGNTSGQVAELPPFPSPGDFPDEVKHKVALFHGTINGCTLQNYSKSPEGYPLSWFDGYDMVLLGDVHLQQIHNVWKNGIFKKGKTPWAYPGSLVQQNFGEPLFGHGFLLWNLEESCVSAFHVVNPVGYISIKEQGGQWYGSFGMDWMPLELFAENKECPKMLYGRIVGMGANADEKEVHEIFGYKGVTCKIVTKFTEDEGQVLTGAVNHEVVGDIDKLNSIHTYIQYVEENKDGKTIAGDVWKEWFASPEKMMFDVEKLPSSVRDLAKDRNTRIYKTIQEYQDKVNSSRTLKTKLKLAYLEWNWILCFKTNCWLNFESLHGKITSINARNGFGKSSFLEVICLALFGEPMMSRYNKENSASVICQQKPKGEQSNVTLRFVLNDQLYQLKRVFTTQAKDASKLLGSHVELGICHDNTDGSAKYTRLHSGKSKIDAWVKENIGSIESFLLSCMVTQNYDQDFFKLKSGAQLQLLDEALNLGSVNTLTDVFKQSGLAYKSLIENIQTLNTQLKEQYEDIDVNAFKKLEQEYTEVMAKRGEIEKEYESIKEIWNGIADEDLCLDESIIVDNIACVKKEIAGFLETHDYESLVQKQGILKHKLEELGGEKIGGEDCVLDVVHVPSIEEVDCARQEFADATSKMEEHMLSRPQKPLGCECEFAEWQEEYVRFYDYVKGAYGNMEELEKLGKATNFSKPAIELSEIQRQQRELDAELSRVKDKQLLSWDESELEMHFAKMKMENDNKETKIGSLALRVSDAEIDLSLKKTAWNNAEEDLKKLLGVGIEQPPRTFEEYTQWASTYDACKLDVDDKKNELETLEKTLEAYNSIVDKQTEVEKELKRVRKSINDIEKAKHPFNHECWACKQQTWKVHLDDLKLNEGELMAEIQACSHEMVGVLNGQDVECLEEKYNVLGQWIDDWNELNGQRAFWSGISERIMMYKEHQDEVKVLQVLVNEKRHAWDIAEQSACALRQEYQKAKEAYGEFSALFYDVTYVFENKENFEKKGEFIRQQQMLWDSYESSMQIKSDYERLHCFHQARDEWEKFNMWQELFGEKEKCVSGLRNAYEALLVMRLTGELREVTQSIEQHKKLDELMGQQRQWETVMSVKPDYHRKAGLRDILESLREKEKALLCEYQKNAIILANNDKIKKQMIIVRATIDQLENKRKMIEHIHRLFIGFRGWLYKHKVIPKILHETNKIVSSVTNSNELQLDADVIYDASTQKLNFAWYIKDGINRPPIEKASGFQQFMVGLGVRITLSYVGAAAVQCHQLFLDEGFVFCDSYHLSRVPEFLNGLLSLFGSIFIVSHLEELKDASQVKINITRQDHLSTLRFGERVNVGMKGKHAS